MKKTTIITASVFAIFVLIVSSCANRRQSFDREWRREQQILNNTDTLFLLQQFARYTAAGFPLQETRGYTDSMLVAKYLNVDMESFTRLERVRHISHMPTVTFGGDIWHSERVAQIERRLMVARQRHRYPRTKIRNIEQAFRWLSAVYSGNPTVRRRIRTHGGISVKTTQFFDISHYKQVDDGFLVKGRIPIGGIGHFSCPCLIRRRYGIFLVGYDHNIVEIKRWVIDPCPNKPYAEINITIHFPEFEEADVRLPELVGHSFDSLLLANTRYPFLALFYNVHGRVVASFIIDADGVASYAEIVQSTYYWFDREVFRTLRESTRWNNLRWIPGMKNGEKIPMKIIVEVEFGAIQWADYAGIRRYQGRFPHRREDIRVSIVSNRNNDECISAFD